LYIKADFGFTFTMHTQSFRDLGKTELPLRVCGAKMHAAGQTLKPELKMSSVSTSSSALWMVAATRPFSVTTPSSSTYLLPKIHGRYLT
jgi:hypothetical protein